MMTMLHAIAVPLALETLGVVVAILPLVLLLLMIAGLWTTFTKAGQPGWAAIIPIYNIFILLKIVGRPAWWLLLFFIPIVNFIVGVIISIDVAKAFEKGVGFAIGLLILPVIFYPILGLGDSTYAGAPN